jgi:hypothetical protein
MEPATLVLIFQINNLNVPYVQIMDEYYYIQSFSPFYHADNYTIVSVRCDQQFDTGERGVICFRSPEVEIICDDVTKLHKYYRHYEKTIRDCPLLMMQLLGIMNEPTAVRYEAWKLVGESYISSLQKDFWVRSEIGLD